MADYEDPAHDLAEVKAKVRVGFLNYRPEALDGAEELDFDRTDIHACIEALELTDFHKSMDALNPKWKGCRQDVYRPVYLGIQLYVKFQLFPGNRVYIVSFKRKEDDDDHSH